MNQFDCEVPVLSSNEVRAELFKLYYESNEFVLHQKADAFEAIDKIIGILHGWLTADQSKLKVFDCINSDC